MKIIKTIINFLIIILSIIILFILVNLLIGCIRVWSFSDYISTLESKDWDTVSQDISWNPTSRFWIFYDDTDTQQIELDPESEKLLNNLDTLLPSDNTMADSSDIDLSGDIAEIEPTFQTWTEDEVIDTWDTWNNPYDPDFEDEFNSFFAGE